MYYWFFVTLSIPDSYGGSFFNKVVILAALGIGTFYMLCKKAEEFKKVQTALEKYIMEKQTLKLIQKN